MAMNILDVLLKNEPPKAEKKREYKIKRLSEAWNTDVVLELKALGYNRVAEIKEMKDEEIPIHIILAGETTGVFKNKELMEKYGVPTPTELVKKILSAGEIEEISMQIEVLSGYRTKTIEEIKKKITEDFETNLLYFLFTEKNVMPSQYYNMPEGEKNVVRAFFLKIMEDRKNKK